MNSSSTLDNSSSLNERPEQVPYFNWLQAEFPLLSAECFEQEFCKQALSELVASQKEAVPDTEDSRIVIHVDRKHPIYNELKKAAFDQFAKLSTLVNEEGQEARKAREFLSYLVTADGYPAYEEFRQELADLGAIQILRLMERQELHKELHSAVSGILAYSQNARASVRMLMLEAFCKYFDPQTKERPTRRELSGILFNALTLELQRPLARQSQEFQERLIQLLAKHPHPECKILLECISKEHSNESMREQAKSLLQHLQESLLSQWENTIEDQVSSLEFREKSLSEIMMHKNQQDQIQAIFNSCKGMDITMLQDPRLPMLNILMSSQSNTICLAASFATSYIYRIEPPCEVAGKAIAVLTDWAVNADDGRYVLDALQAVKNFEQLSDTCKQKIENAYISANQKFIFRSVMNNQET